MTTVSLDVVRRSTPTARKSDSTQQHLDELRCHDYSRHFQPASRADVARSRTLADSSPPTIALGPDEPPLNRSGSDPVHLDACRRLLDAETPVTELRHALAWVIPDQPCSRHDVEPIGSESPEGAQVLASFDRDGMPKALGDLGCVDAGEFWAPWCPAMSEGEVASSAFRRTDRFVCRGDRRRNHAFGFVVAALRR